MRTLSIVAVLALFGTGLAVGVTLANQAAANAPAQTSVQPTMMIDQLTADAKNLPDQPYVAP